MSHLSSNDRSEENDTTQVQPWVCHHPRFTLWSSNASVIILDGMGGRTELIRYIRHCQHCRTCQDHWFDINIDPNAEGVPHG